MKKILPTNLHIPSRNTISTTLNTYYNEIMNMVRVILSDNIDISLTFDFWTKNGLSFLGSTAHFIDKDWIQINSVLFAMKYVEGNHHTSNILQWMSSIFNSFSLSKFVAIITDDAMNMVASRLALRSKRIVMYEYGCYVHRIQTVVRSVITLIHHQN